MTTQSSRAIMEATLVRHVPRFYNENKPELGQICMACFGTRIWWPCEPQVLAALGIHELDEADKLTKLLQPLSRVNLHPWSANFVGDKWLKDWECPWCGDVSNHEDDCPIIKWQHQQLPTIGEFTS